MYAARSTEDVVRRSVVGSYRLGVGFTAPGPLTARIWGVPMRAARSYGLGARIADVRREQSIIDGINWIASGERCMWCGETNCAHPLH